MKSQEDFLKVAALSRSTKEVKFSSFPRAPCLESSISRKRAKMKCLSNLEKVLVKFVRRTFSK